MTTSRLQHFRDLCPKAQARDSGVHVKACQVSSPKGSIAKAWRWEGHELSINSKRWHFLHRYNPLFPEQLAERHFSQRCEKAYSTVLSRHRDLSQVPQ